MGDKRGVWCFCVEQSRLVGHVRCLVHQRGLPGDIRPNIPVVIGICSLFMTQIARVRVVFSARKLILILLSGAVVLLIAAAIHGDRSGALKVCGRVLCILLDGRLLVEIYSDDVTAVRRSVNFQHVVN